MSKEAVESIIGRAVLDGEFRETLFADPDAALGGYELAEEEVSALRAIDAETMESLAGTLDERISKSAAANLFLAQFSLKEQWSKPAFGPVDQPM